MLSVISRMRVAVAMPKDLARLALQGLGARRSTELTVSQYSVQASLSAVAWTLPPRSLSHREGNGGGALPLGTGDTVR